MKTQTYKNTEICELHGLYVIHFLSIEETDVKSDGMDFVKLAYMRAQNKASEFKGTKFHNRTYGGGIGFQSLAACKACIDKYSTESEVTA